MRLRKSTKRELRIFLASVLIGMILVLCALFFSHDGPYQNPVVGKTLTEILWGGKK